MIQAYSGEFTISPIPLEMSMNYCSHACSYCFANLNSPDRKLDVNKTINQIKNQEKGKSLVAYLLRNKYPILLSNRVDPFAHSNWRQTLSFLELFNEFGNKVAFQTRGGQGVDEALNIIDYKASWYITINIWDDLIRQVVEPGAPTVQSKLDLCEKLLSLGHHVSVGINPIVEDWLPIEDFELLFDALCKIGIRDFWLEQLHLNGNQIKRMSKREQNAVGKEVIDEAKKRRQNTSYLMYCHDLVKNSGSNIYSMNQDAQSSFFDKYKELYDGKILQTHQQFINACFKALPNGGDVYFADYYEFMKEDFFEMEFSECDGYVYRIARNVWKDLPNDQKPVKTLKDVLKLYWNHNRISKSLLNNRLFQIYSGKDEKGEVFDWLDSDDMAIYKFNPNGTENDSIYI